MKTTNTEIKLWVGNLGKYNEGELVGEWFTLPHDLEDIYVTIGVGKYDENGEYSHGVAEGDYYYEEWYIGDYEAPFKVGEYDSIKKLNEIAEKMEDLDDQEIQACSELVSHGIANDLLEAVDMLEDVMYYHDCKNMEDVAYSFYEETGQLAELTKHINESYIDFESIGRDMDIEGTFIELEGNVYMQYIG